MKKVLFVATVTTHINAFHIPYLKWFKEQGVEATEKKMTEYIDTKKVLHLKAFMIFI